MTAITETKPAPKAKPARKKPAPKPTVQKAERPYLLESDVATQGMERQQKNTLRAIDVINEDIRSIERRRDHENAEINESADRNKALIDECRDRDVAAVGKWADAEIAAREDRKRDLEKTLDILTNGVGYQQAPLRGSDVALQAVDKALNVVKAA